MKQPSVIDKHIMKKIILISMSVLTMLVCITLLTFVPNVVLKLKNNSEDALLLLIPDANADPKLIQAWQNTALEEGLHLEIQTDNEFLLPINQRHIQYKGIILPDTIHARMSHYLAASLKSYVNTGGKLFLVYDAGTKNLNGYPYKKGSLFSPMLHFQYGLVTESGESGITQGPVGNGKKTLAQYGIPPGKCMIDENSTAIIPNEFFCAISTYDYGPLAYQHFITKPIKYDIPLILTTVDHQFIAGVRPFGNGKILFVNLPLSHLWFRTDALPLHVFLHYFAVDMLAAPHLAMVPEGIGGLVMNLHVESKDALPALSILKEMGVFQQGPYSIDFTVGPDLDKPGDNNGVDLVHNPEAQHWVKYLAKQGNEIGSDGGWMHNYFGINVNETNQHKFQKYITISIQAIEKILGQKIREYVPSMGNQPKWATKYIERQGFIGYYSTGNTGSPPVIDVKNGASRHSNLWSFPCLPFGAYANFRDFGFAKVRADDVKDWLAESSEFVASQHTSRLIYYHPTDILYFKQYIDCIKAWLAETKYLMSTGVFHWYTMVDLAEFLNVRKDVYWKVENTKNHQIITASHINTLARQTWIVVKQACSKPTITVGSGTIREDDKHWLITAGNVKTFQFQCQQQA